MADDGILSHTDPYRLETVSRACEIIKCFEANDEWLTLSEIVRRTGLNKTVVFRLAHTLSCQGLLERSTSRGYRSKTKITGRNRIRIGYAAQWDDSPFSAAVTSGLRAAAARQDVELVIVDNKFSAAEAVKNAQQLISERVSIAIDFQTYEKVAPRIAAMFTEANIPLIAVEVPHPGAIFYGADNYRIGLLAGRALGRWAKRHWAGDVEQLLFLQCGAAGPVPQLRISGAEAGIREALPGLQAPGISLEAKGSFPAALEATRKYLTRTHAKRILVSGINDAVVLGALRAFEEAGQSVRCAAVSNGAIPEAIMELRKTGTRLIASVAFFPERYGFEILQLAIDILQRRAVPPAIYAHHELVAPGNVNRLYPIALANPQLAATRSFPV